MKGFIKLTNVYQDAPTIVNVQNICYFYKQDTGTKHTVIIVNGLEHGLSVQEDFEQVLKLIEESAGDQKAGHDAPAAQPPAS
ncbi:MAG: hypothetical protein JST83_06730 [Bacteroidetes bacterium]|nr:hypothetical protein [Bacteroidota bacterium]